MKSPYNTGSQNRSRGGKPHQAPTASPYSVATEGSAAAARNRSSISSVVGSIAGIFLACFTPPADTSAASNNFIAYSDHSSNIGSMQSRKSKDRRRSSGQGMYGSQNNSTHGRGLSNVSFTMDEIRKATENFSPSFKIGQGGFGIVYKGRLADGTLVAIKRAKKSVYDKHLGMEFRNETKMLAQVEHLNLVRYYGFLEHGDEKVVVVEYVVNGTLREHLDGIYGDVLDLAVRLDIATDVAHAITYLHMYTDHPIIHRDIKSSNILLTENFRAKVADFGFARLAADTDAGETHVSTQVKGTAGYLDPEYVTSYHLTEKSDVYSFGVLLVELITGRRPIEPRRELKERITAKWAVKKFLEGDAILTLDPRLERTAASRLAIEKIYELAVQCMASRRQMRPSMKTCAEVLWSIRKDYKNLLS